MFVNDVSKLYGNKSTIGKGSTMSSRSVMSSQPVMSSRLLYAAGKRRVDKTALYSTEHFFCIEKAWNKSTNFKHIARYDQVLE